jgi:elongation factor Tu
MGLWPFGRNQTDDKNVETLLAEANVASPTPGGFRLPVEDVFMITGRGTVVTGRVQAGVGTIGLPVRVVRNGAAVATSRITAIEAFRKKLEIAQAGENVGLLLDGLSRDQVQAGDMIEG